MPTVALNGVDIFYMQHGDGLPCLVMHGGLGLDHSYLHPWLDALGADLRLVYYDHRGNGRSGRPPLDTLSFAQFCADADALREHLGFAEVAVLGHSIGGLIAQEYALCYPERVSHLILVGTAARCDFGALPARLDRIGVAPEILAAFAAGLDSDAALARFFEITAPVGYHAFDADVAARHRQHIVYDAAAVGAAWRWSRARILRRAWARSPHRR
jgi:proline iminopeptidase